MTTKPFSFIAMALLITAIAGPGTVAQRRSVTRVALTPRGHELEAAYAERLETLRGELRKVVRPPSPRKKAAWNGAKEAEKTAKAALTAAKQALGEVKTAKALVGHAKGKWIGGADRGIAKARAALEKATTDTERAAAQKALAKWQDNRSAGLQALKERQARLDEALRAQPRLVEAVESAEQALARSERRAMKAVDRLGLRSFLSSGRWDARLARYVLLLEATPRGLATFAQQGEAREKLVEAMLADEDLVLQMVVADGARGGKYGEAMAIYADIQAASRRSKKGALQRLAVAVALEHATPVKQRNPKRASSAPTLVDPVARYLHYEKAFVDGELDPGFGELSVWDYRMVVDGNEPDDTLAWGRTMLRNYRPDHVYSSDYRWRYVAAVRTDVRYGSQDNRYDKPELQFFQNILMNGGVCGRRAFFGRFILRAFGIPTTARPQRGHAALAHWTPDGWVVCLGAGWGSGWTKTRYRSDLDFLATTQARADRSRYLQVKRAQWIGDLFGEKRVFGFQAGNPGFWYGVSLYRQRALNRESKAATLSAVGEELGEANESSVKYALEAASVTEEDRRVTVDDQGVITIPAVACRTPRKSTRKIIFMPSNLGGKQLHYSRTGRPRDFEYVLDVPAGGRYELRARVVTPSWGQRLVVSVNGKQSVPMPLPHTVGLWGLTSPVEVALTAGQNVLRFRHESEGYAKGFTIRHFSLAPKH